MRPLVLRTLLTITIIVPACLMVACSTVDKPTAQMVSQAMALVASDDAMTVYFRDDDLLALTEPKPTVYPSIEPGDSKIFYPGFPGAPPQIPHSVEDMLPITGTINACLDCHHPDNAVVADGDVPLPESHFTNAVMADGAAGQPMVWVVAEYEVAETMSGMRYNCTACHAPQAEGVDTPANTFDEES